MTAIIKNKFRLQNARDFLESFVQHPRMQDAQPKNLIDAVTITSVNAETKVAAAQLNFTWLLDQRITNFQTNNQEIKNDSERGLITSIGSHVKDRNHYLFVGKALPWGSTTAAEATPPLPQDTLIEERQVWQEMLSLKKISDLDASLVIPRSDWDEKKNTVYVPFDDSDVNLYRHPTVQEIQTQRQTGKFAGNFYVLTDEAHLFICIENGNGAKSTEKPRRPAVVTDLLDYRHLDGYVWKYVTTIKPSDITKFLTDSWIPVRTLGNVADDGSSQWQVENAATPGSVLSFIVENQGSGYLKTLSGTLSNVGAVNGNSVATLVADAGQTASVEADYYVGAQLYVTEGADAGNSYDIIAYDTTNGAKIVKINGLWQVDATSKFSILPKVVVSSDSTTLIKVLPVVNSGKIIGVKILSAGRNASFVSATIVENSAQIGGGAQAKIRAVLGPVDGLGKDLEKDLGAYFVMLNAKLVYQEGSGDFTQQNDYRQIGIIRNVKRPDGRLATDNTLNAAKRLTVSNITSGSFLPDEEFLTSSDGGNTWSSAGRVLEFNADLTQNNVGYMSVFKTLGPSTSLSSGNSIRGVTSGTQAKITAIVAEEVKKFDGEILYLENRRPILRSPDQIEDIKAIVEF